jgi:transcription antitermination factor NusG
MKAKKIKVNFNKGVIGAPIEHTSAETAQLHYTQHLPEYNITLDLNIWGGTSISIYVGFLHGGNNANKYGYFAKSVNKKDWDEKSVEWFDSLVKDAIKNLQESKAKISGSVIDTEIDGAELTIKIAKEKLEEVLPILVNNFLNYNYAHFKKYPKAKSYPGIAQEFGVYKYQPESAVQVGDWVLEDSDDKRLLVVKSIENGIVSVADSYDQISDFSEFTLRQVNKFIANGEWMIYNPKITISLGDAYLDEAGNIVKVSNIDNEEVIYINSGGDSNALSEQRSPQQIQYLVDYEWELAYKGNNEPMKYDAGQKVVLKNGKSTEIVDYGYPNETGTEWLYTVEGGDILGFDTIAESDILGLQNDLPLYDNDDILLYKNNVYMSYGEPENEDNLGWHYDLWSPNLDQPIWNVPENELKKVTTEDMIEYLSGHALVTDETLAFEKLNLSKKDQEALAWDEVSKEGLEVMFLWYMGYNQLDPPLPHEEEDESDDVWVLSTYVDYLYHFGKQEDIDKFYIAISNVIGRDASELDNYESAITVDEVVAFLRKSKTPLSLVIAELKRVKAKQFIDVDKELEKHNTKHAFEVGDTVSYKDDTNSGKVFYGVIKSINGNIAKVSALDSNFEQDIQLSELTLSTLPKSYADGGNLLNFGYSIGGL